MNDLTKKQINVVYQALNSTVEYLYNRWQDEREYEDFKEYDKLMREKLLEAYPNATNVKTSKRPFGISFDIDSIRVTVYCNAKSIGWKAKHVA